MNEITHSDGQVLEDLAHSSGVEETELAAVVEQEMHAKAVCRYECHHRASSRAHIAPRTVITARRHACNEMRAGAAMNGWMGGGSSR